MKIAIGADHAGYPLKQELVQFLQSSGHEVTDCGIDTAANSVDYPDFAKMVGELIQHGTVERSILSCVSMLLKTSKILSSRSELSKLSQMVNSIS